MGRRRRELFSLVKSEEAQKKMPANGSKNTETLTNQLLDSLPGSLRPLVVAWDTQGQLFLVERAQPPQSSKPWKLLASLYPSPPRTLDRPRRACGMNAASNFSSKQDSKRKGNV